MPVNFLSIDDPLQALLRGSTAVGRTGRRPSAPYMSPEEETGFVRSLAQKALPPISALGAFLDLPASVGRDLISSAVSGEWKNPIDQFLSPTSWENRVMGRDILEQAGMGPNREGLDWGDVAGFGVDVLTDPLTYLGGVGLLKSLGRGGGILKRAGAAIPKSRVARMTTPVGRLAGTVAPEALEAAAKGRGFSSAADFLSRHGKEPIGGLLSYNRPLGIGGPRGLIGTGAAAQRVGGALDVLGAGIRESLPGREVSRLFSAAVRGGRTMAEQRFGGKLSGLEKKAASEIDSFAVNLARTIKDVDPKLLTEEGMGPLRNAFELPAVEVPGALKALSGSVKDRIATVLRSAQDGGAAIEKLKDRFTDYFPRGVERFAKEPELGSRAAMGKFLGHGLARRDYLRDIPGLPQQGATQTLREMFQDSDLLVLLEAKTKRADVADFLREKWSGPIPEQYAVFKKAKPLLDAGGKPVLADRFSQLAGLAKRAYAKNPELLTKGVFRADPLDDLYRYLHSVRRAEITGRSLTEFIDQDLLEFVPHGEPGIRLSRMLQQMGLDPKRMAKNAGFIDEAEVKAWLGRRVSGDSYRQIHKMTSFSTAEDAAGALLKGYRWAHNLWKGLATGPWPAFNSRNYGSGFFQNVLTGLLRPSHAKGALQDAHLLVTGRNVADAALIPEVQSLLKARSLPDSAATDVLRELATAHNVWRSLGQLGSEVIGPVAKKEAGFRGLLERIPGGLGGEAPMYAEGAFQPVREYLRQMGGVGPDVTWNPRKATIRGGLAEAERSTFAPLAAGEKLGSWIESQNRIAPFIDQLRRGVAPEEAARRIAAAQVDYSARAFTPFEQGLKSIFPFYSFSSRQAKFLASEVTNRPGGPFGQLFRGMSYGGSDTEFLPEYLAKTLAIPVSPTLPFLGQPDPETKRFITGFGLMHEDPLQFLGRGAGMELLSRTNPLIKAPLEYMTGQSFFQTGPAGGRPLEDMDPAMGRIVANIRQLATGKEATGRAQPVGGALLEHIAANIPGARAISSLRTLTDPRKGMSGVLANLLTGVRVSDIPPRVQDAVLRDLIASQQKALGAREFPVTYVPEEVKARMGPTDLKNLEQLNALRRINDRRRRERQQTR